MSATITQIMDRSKAAIDSYLDTMLTGGPRVHCQLYLDTDADTLCYYEEVSDQTWHQRDDGSLVKIVAGYSYCDSDVSGIDIDDERVELTKVIYESLVDYVGRLPARKRLAVYLRDGVSVSDAHGGGWDIYGGAVDCHLVSSVDGHPSCVVLDVAERDLNYVCAELDEDDAVAEYAVRS